MTSRPAGPKLEPPVPPATWLPHGLLGVIRRRWWLVAAAVVIALGLAFVYHRTTSPLYEATAQLLVVKKLPDAVTGVDTRALAVDDYVATHQTLLHSPLLVEKAVRKHGLTDLASLAEEKDVTETILQGLTVLRNKAPGGNTDNVLNLYYYGPNARECPVVLDALIDSFKNHLDETYRTLAGESLRLITQARSELHQELLEKEAAYRRFRKETPLLLLKGKDEATLRQDQLSTIDAKRATLHIRQAELRGQLAVLEAARQGGGNHDGLVAMVTGWTAQADAARGIVQTTVPDRLLPLLAEEHKLLETRGEKHPEVAALRKRIDATRRLLAAPSAPGRMEAGKPSLDGDMVDPVEAYRSYCRQELQHLEIAEQFLSEVYQKEHDRARALAASELEDEGYRVALERQQRLYDSVIKQLQQVDLVKNLGGYEAQVIGPPGPGKKIRPNALIVLPGALFLGLLAGLGLAFVAEIRDRRLHSAEEIRTLLGLPVLAHIPRIPASGGCKRPGKGGSPGGLHPPLAGLVAYSQPHSPAAEAFRRVRTALCFGQVAAGCRFIQVTSPNASDGSTTLAANLAVSMAQSGRRILLIDANLRRPCLHELFQLPAEPGWTAVLAGTAFTAAAIQATAIEGLSVLPAGPGAACPADLLTTPAFPKLLADLGDQFDCVIVDTPALLTYTEAGAVAASVDGVLLNVRVGKNSRPTVERAVTLLQDLGARGLGVVISGVGRRSGYRCERATEPDA
jgi:capsular exopolysaccharide synthesis family protein